MIQRLNPTARYADAVAHQGIVYAVEVPATETDDIATQSREVLEALEATLALSDSGKDRLLMATVYLTDIAASYDAFNAEWERWLPAGAAPVRACVEVRALTHPGWKIEIAVTAAVGEGKD
ncbi:RidA family protein [Niveibacterium terrae]|uniref:RidA family protein n=1 Tax=Niveibacterium terrae TaxID=3373598 RepID=UPI003A95D21D